MGTESVYILGKDRAAELAGVVRHVRRETRENYNLTPLDGATPRAADNTGVTLKITGAFGTGGVGYGLYAAVLQTADATATPPVWYDDEDVWAMPAAGGSLAVGDIILNARLVGIAGDDRPIFTGAAAGCCGWGADRYTLATGVGHDGVAYDAMTLTHVRPPLGGLSWTQATFDTTACAMTLPPGLGEVQVHAFATFRVLDLYDPANAPGFFGIDDCHFTVEATLVDRDAPGNPTGAKMAVTGQVRGAAEDWRNYGGDGLRLWTVGVNVNWERQISEHPVIVVGDSPVRLAWRVTMVLFTDDPTPDLPPVTASVQVYWLGTNSGIWFEKVCCDVGEGSGSGSGSGSDDSCCSEELVEVSLVVSADGNDYTLPMIGPATWAFTGLSESITLMRVSCLAGAWNMTAVVDGVTYSNVPAVSAACGPFSALFDGPDLGFVGDVTVEAA